MDRLILRIGGGILLPLGLLGLGGCDAAPVTWTTPASGTETPRLLDLQGELCQPLPALASGRILRAGFPREAELPLAAPQVDLGRPDLEANAGPLAIDRPSSTRHGDADQPRLEHSPRMLGAGPADAVVLPEGSTQTEANLSESGKDECLLPWARPSERTPEIAALMDKADQQTRRGLELAGRRASYSARVQFLSALRLIAQALDAEQRTELYSVSLDRGLTALEEARELLDEHGDPRKGPIEARIKAHRTAILKDDGGPLDATSARRRYLTYAQEQLGVAAGQERAGSMALYGLGRITVADASPLERSSMERAAEAMVWYQAALLAHGDNYLAANELGVLLAEYGRREAARDLLTRAVSLAPSPVVWNNLAAVQERLGDQEAARQARREAARLSPDRSSSGVRWVEPQDFARTVQPMGDPAKPSGTKPAAPKAENQRLMEAKQSPLRWFPWSGTR